MVASERKSAILFMAYLRCEGRITVPKEIRDAFKIREGDLVECQIKKVT
jgi:bifunctional DNA-binding transcriptional regulator/antitoxin component of YhaV-PrlF toxin-antitoxin module